LHELPKPTTTTTTTTTTITNNKPVRRRLCSFDKKAPSITDPRSNLGHGKDFQGAAIEIATGQTRDAACGEGWIQSQCIIVIIIIVRLNF
jgi:hypothetical protein